VFVCNYLSRADPSWENKFWSSHIIPHLLWYPKFITILLTNCNLSHSCATSSNTKPLRCLLIILSDIVRHSSGVYSRCTNTSIRVYAQVSHLLYLPCAFPSHFICYVLHATFSMFLLRSLLLYFVYFSLCSLFPLTRRFFTFFAQFSHPRGEIICYRP